MKRVTVVILFIAEAILISSCIVSKQPNPTLTQAFSATQEISTTDFKPTTTLTTSQTLTTVTKIVDICPSSRFVPLEELEIPDQFRLIVIPPELERDGDYETSYSLIVPSTSKVVEVDVSPPANTVNQFYVISPDGQWVSFLRQPLNDPTNRTLWISSLNGEKQWEVMQFREPFRSYKWVSLDEIIVYGPQYNGSEVYPPTYYYMPLAVINPFTLEEQPIAPLPQKYVDEQQDQMFAFRNGTLYNMFASMRTGSIFLHSYKDNTTHQILTWLNIPGINNDSIHIYREDDLFVVKVDQPYGFDLSPKLNLSDITQQQDYSKIMRKIILPTDFGFLRVAYKLPKSNFWSVYQKTDIDSNSPIPYFTLDAQFKNLNNYCFSAPHYSYADESPDGNFIAFSQNYAGSEYPEGEITILNLKTGYASIVKGYKLIAWGIQE